MKRDRNEVYRLFVLYLICLLPRVMLLLWRGLAEEVPTVFLSARRAPPFWDSLPGLLHAVSTGLPSSHPLLPGILYALVSAAVAPIVYRLALSLKLSRASAMWGALGVSFYPYYVSTNAYQPEVGITIVLTAACTLIFAGFAEAPSIRKAWGCGVLVSLLLLDRAEAVIYVGFLASMALVRLRSSPIYPKLAISLGASMLVPLLGLSTANALAFDRFSPFPAKSGYNLLLGHNSAVNQYLKENHRSTMESAVLDSALAAFPREIQADNQNPAYSPLFRQRAMAFIREHPRLTVINTGYKLLRYFDLRLEDAENENAVKRASYTISYLVVLALGAVGVGFLARSGRAFSVLFALGGVLAFSIPSLVTTPLIRVRMYSEFLLILLAAAGLQALLHPGRFWGCITTDQEGRHPCPS